METNQLIFLSNPTSIWNDLKDKSEFLSDWGLKLLKGNLQNFVKTIIIERNYTCKDHKNLYSNFYSKKFKPISSKTERIHFLKSKISDKYNLIENINEIENNYIGFSVIRPIFERTIGRTIIDQSKISKGISEGFYSLSANYPVNLMGVRLKARGYPYLSQDTEVTVCAHSALWGLCRFLSQRFSIYREMYPFDFVHLSDNTKGRALPYRGMTYEDYSKILSDFGCFPLVMRLKKRTDDKEIPEDKFQEVYSYVESGFPVLASYTGHVVALIGHTIDYSKSIDQTKEYIDSSFFLKQFIVVDDNYFPYGTLGFENDPANYSRRYNINSINTIVCPLPEKAYLPADKARVKITTFLDLLSSEIQKYGKKPYITRLFLASGSSFKRKKLKNFNENEKNSLKDEILLNILEFDFPHFVWVMEIACLDDYKNKRVTSEIVLDATVGYREEGILYARVGNSLYENKNTKTEFTDSSIYFEQFLNNLGEI
jgi:hypothetical protein